MSKITFWLNDRLIEEDEAAGTQTLLRYLRDDRHMPGTKEGCGEGDCGACTVALVERKDDGSATFRAVNSCLMFLPMCQGKRIYTVEALRKRSRSMESSSSGFHPVQWSMVKTRGSQCGYCTPGIIMSIFEACYREDMGEEWQLDDQLCGNLCRCTGYRPIRDAARDVAGARPEDRFLAELNNFRPGSAAMDKYEADYEGSDQIYYQPASLQALWQIRAEHPKALLVAGGTDIGLWATKFHFDMPVVVGLEAIEDLKQLQRTDTHWQIGGGVNLTRLHETVGAEISGIDKMMRVFGSRQIRSRATVGGNICNASPIGDTPPMFIALGAQVVIAGSGGQRRVPLDEFFLAYRKTALQADEVLLRLDVPHPSSTSFFATYKVSKRRELDISAVAAGMFVDFDAAGNVSVIRLAYGGVAATPIRATSAEAFLLGKAWTDENISAAMACIDDDFSPISDHRGSARYRTLLARNLLRGFFLESQRSDRDRVVDRPSGTVMPSAALGAK